MGRAYEVRKASIQKTGAARGKIYSMYAKEIYQAAKNGGTSLEANSALKRLVERAKKEQVPQDIIKRAIDKVNSGVDETYTKNTYEMFGPAGSTLIIECLTDNVNRTVSDLRAVVNKCHVKLGNVGSVSYNYDNLCVVSFKGLSLEDTLNVLIENDIDVKDIEEDEDDNDAFRIEEIDVNSKDSNFEVEENLEPDSSYEEEIEEDEDDFDNLEFPGIDEVDEEDEGE